MKLYTDNVSLRKIFDIKVRYLLFLGLFLSIIRLAYLYNKPEDKNFNLYFFAISFAPVDFPVAAPPSQVIFK